MLATHPVGYLRFLISIAALGLLAALLLFPAPVRAQAAPMITGDATARVPENTATSEVIKTYMATDPDSDPLTWSLGGEDAGQFTLIANTGNTGYELKFSSSPDFESPTDTGMDNGYNVTIQVADDETTPMMATLAVTVYVTNVDEAGTASFTGTLSGGSTLTASVTDPDGSIGSKSYQWQRGNTASGNFLPISPNGASETYVPVAADVGKWLKVKVSYADAEGSGKSATSVSRGPIGASNFEPTFSSMTATRELPENSSAETNAGSAVAATDGDSDTLTYALKSGNDSGDFTIVSTSGQIQAKSGETYNYEGSKNSYTVIVTVHDGKDAAGGNSTAVDDEITVTINLTNVNETPMLTSPPTTKSVPENSTSVHSYAATDVDADTVISWSLSGADAGDFSISTSGVRTFSSAPDFENPTDSMNGGGFNAYIVTVRATDNGSPPMNDGHTLTVTVTDVNETPTITSGPTTISKDENTPTTEIIATYVATDPDATTGTLTWDLQGNDAGDFTIMSTINGTANLTFKVSPNYEDPDDAGTDNVYDVTVRVKDNGSTRLQDTQVVAVTVNDVNETPVISGGAAPSFAEIEFDVVRTTLTVADLTVSGSFTFYDDDGDDVTWSVSGDDGNHFDITKNTGDGFELHLV